MEERKTALTDSLVKAASWTHNTLVNKLEYSPLQLVTIKAVTLPGLTMGNTATESMTDCEAVQRTMENLNKVVTEFRDGDIKQKLKECQDQRIQAYQHLDNYLEGDEVWYQPQNANSWLGLAILLCYGGQTVWLLENGEIKKVAACKVKPYKLIDRNMVDDCNCDKTKKKVMLEDGLVDRDKLITPEEEEKKEAIKSTDVASAAMGKNFLKIENSEAFTPFSIYTVEVLVSVHGTQEVKYAKVAKINNLMDYDVFEEVADEGQEVLGSRWVVIAKEKHDGQKQQTKARLVV